MISVKNYIFILLSVIAITLSACDKAIKNCVEDITGTYTGSDSCSNSSNEVEVGVGTENEDIVINIINNFGLNATVDKDCNITIPFQSKTFNTGEEATYEGTGVFIQDSLIFTITQDIIGSTEDDAVCEFRVGK